MKICIQTLGCKVNQFESQALETMFSERGHIICNQEDSCDVIIINTCAVTAESCRKSRQTVRHAKRTNPDAFIAICGCFSQISPNEIKALEADLIAGSGDRAQFAENLERHFQQRTKGMYIDKVQERRIFENLQAGSLSGRTRAMLKIQDGCDNYCAYCIIPYARGPVRSLPTEKAISEAVRLQQEGFSELVITGIEISSYGKDLKNGASLKSLISAVGEHVPNMRIRLGSLEPRTVTEDFCLALSKMSNVCDHFHLSLQSGCDETLSKMKRKYNTNTFSQAIQTLRNFFPDCGITADLIVGFPGETEEAFSETMDFIKTCAFSSMHIFPYSIRAGTAAAEMDNHVEKSVKRKRALIAGETANEMEIKYLQSFIGKTLNVLFERESGGYSVGHACNYSQVQVAEIGLRNMIFPVNITGLKGSTLLGEISSSNV